MVFTITNVNENLITVKYSFGLEISVPYHTAGKNSVGYYKEKNIGNGQEKYLRHVAMVAKFLDDNKPKTSLKSEFALFQTSSILFNFI